MVSLTPPEEELSREVPEEVFPTLLLVDPGGVVVILTSGEGGIKISVFGSALKSVGERNKLSIIK